MSINSRKKNRSSIVGKSSFARLLACENLVLIHDEKAQTASFDLKKRVVKLPMLNHMVGYTYNAFIAHEISHALYTPPEDYMRVAEEMGLSEIINITEDARIEKLIQRKYPGIRRDFYSFYRDTVDPEIDFFGLQKRDKDLSKLSLADRINLHFKAGQFLKVPFLPEEKEIFDMVAKEETFEDAEAAAWKIFEYMKNKNQIVEIPQSGLEYTEDEEDKEDGKEGQPGKKVNGKGKGKPTKFKIKNDDGSEGSNQKAFDKAFAEKNIDNSGQSSSGNAPQYQMSDVEKVVAETVKIPSQAHVSDTSYMSFMSKNMPVVNMMSSTFNRKKSARDFQKTRVNKTGRLDMKDIALYKVNENIFRSTEVVPEAKNHGFVMFIDWSGSMSQHIDNTYKQLLILMEFCRKISVPFEVYGFTTYSGEAIRPAKGFTQNDIRPSDSGQVIFKLFDSGMKKSEYKTASKDMFKICETGNYNDIVSMGSTPLNTACMLAKPVLESFRYRTKVEKAFFILLSDGGATDSINKSYGYRNGGGNTYIRDTNNGMNYAISNGEASYHGVLEYVKKSVGIDKMIGFFLTDTLSRSDVNLIAPHVSSEFNQIEQKFNKNKVVSLTKGQSFDTYYAVSVNNFDTTNNTGTTFGAQLLNTKKSMLFLNNFVEQIS